MTTPKQQLREILTVYLSNKQNDMEVEAKFGKIKPISRSDFDNIAKYILSKGWKIRQDEYMLRIGQEDMRGEIKGIHNISEYCRTDSIKDANGEMIDITFMEKAYYKKEKTYYPVDFDDFNFRVSMHSEKEKRDVDANGWADKKKTFRFIRRNKFVHEDYPFVVDMSIVKTSKKQGKDYVPEYKFKDSGVVESLETYEVEIEMLNDKVDELGMDVDVLEHRFKQAITHVLSGLQGTAYPISYTEQKKVLDEYMNILWEKQNKPHVIQSRHFVGPSSLTLQMQNIRSIEEDSALPNIRSNYTVTDKADGDRKLLYISSTGKLYFIDTNMNVQSTGSKTDNKEVYNTVLDGEHILHNKKGQYINLYAAFDIYYLNKKDVRMLEFVLDTTECRLSLLTKCVNSLDVKSVINEKSVVRIETKRFLMETEKQNIFNSCMHVLQKQKEDLLEYEIDGLIFTPKLLGVGSDKVGATVKPSKTTWVHSFKWKPAEFNTIDFLITTKKTASGQEEVGNIFKDGTNVNSATQLTQYKTLTLRVGFDERKHGYINPYQSLIDDELPKPEDEKYKPVRFYPTNPSDNDAGLCKVLLHDKDGKKLMMTEENEIIEDNMIVEFRYDLTKDKGWRWVPLRVRYDKTEDFRKTGNNFGNAYHVANSNWQSIHNPITEEMITTGNNIGEELGDDDVYYNKVSSTTQTRALRDFHNLFVKKKLIMDVSKPNDTLIDLAVGKGGDFPKWIAAKLSFVFGVDLAKDNIHNRLDGACARYLNHKKRYNKMPGALFVVGNSSINIRNTDAVITEKDKQITRAVFGEGAKDAKLLGKGVYDRYGVAKYGFNICSIQFAIHYMFESHNVLTQFIRNVSETTAIGGYFIGTCYDGNLLFNMLKKIKKGERINVSHENEKIWEVTKQYDDEEYVSDPTCIGYGIDVFQETINKTFREYLVNFDYLVRVMENAGFILAEKEDLKDMNMPSGSGLFVELYNNMTEELKQKRYSSNKYGQALNMTEEEKKISFLNRYFIFKKIRDVDHTSYDAEVEEEEKEEEKDEEIQDKKEEVKDEKKDEKKEEKKKEEKTPPKIKVIEKPAIIEGYKTPVRKSKIEYREYKTGDDVVKITPTAVKPYYKLSNLALIKDGIEDEEKRYLSVEALFNSKKFIPSDQPRFTDKGDIGTQEGFKLLFKDAEKKQTLWMKKDNIGILARMVTNPKTTKQLGLTPDKNFVSDDELWLGMLRKKFENKEFKDALLKTGNKYLLEHDKTAKDGTSYWSGNVVDGKLHGNNQMGKYLMKIREELS